MKPNCTKKEQKSVTFYRDITFEPLQTGTENAKSLNLLGKP